MLASGSINFMREIPVRYQVDVCVVGGGPAGVAAAVMAARQGRHVFLVEGQGCFGGMGTAGGLPMFVSLSDGVNFLADGIGREVTERLTAAGGAAPVFITYPNDMIFKSEVLKRVYDDMVTESGVAYSFYTQFVEVEVEADQVQAIICHGKSGLFAIQATTFIDCSGDGDLCARAGVPFVQGDAAGQMQAPTLCSVWAGIDWKTAVAAGFYYWDQEQHLPRAIADNVFTVPDYHLPGMVPISEHLGGGNLGHLFGTDGTDERSISKAMVWGRKLLLEYERFFKEYCTGFEQMELAATAALLGVRETRRILGDYVLTVEAYLRRASFPDDIGRFAYAVDVHAVQPGQENYAETLRNLTNGRLQPGESYGIPYRTLTPCGLSNVWMAGRCISGDRYILGSLRSMPACFITGQAAGLAAALAVELGVTNRTVPIPILQTRLRDAGAFLPEVDPSLMQEC